MVQKPHWGWDEVASSFVSLDGIGGGATWPVVVLVDSSLSPITLRRRPFLI